MNPAFGEGKNAWTIALERKCPVVTPTFISGVERSDILEEENTGSYRVAQSEHLLHHGAHQHLRQRDYSLGPKPRRVDGKTAA